MNEDNERIARIAAALTEAGLDALVCTLPENVLLLSGYWPVVGSALAVATGDGRTAVLAPEDERELAERGRCDEVRTYEPGSLARLTGPAEAARGPLAALLADLGLGRGRLGHEAGAAYEPASYAAIYLFGPAIVGLLGAAAPQAHLIGAAAPLARLRSRLTAAEVGRVRQACAIGAGAFAAGAGGLQPGLTEAQAAAGFQAPLSIDGLGRAGVQRAGGFVYCMSGPNAAQAGGAYARTRARTLRAGDLVLVHCNSYVDGYWTDITRTYCLGRPDEHRRALYAAVFEARAAALRAIRPGARAAEVDAAARRVFAERGLEQHFTHGVGHNVGFSAISAEYPPRLHPASPDLLEVGMTFNVEPALYLHGYGGLRHCDVVTLTDQGPEILTPFQATPDELVIGG